MSEEQRKATNEDPTKDQETTRALSEKELEDVVGGAGRRNANERGGRESLRYSLFRRFKTILFR